MQNETPHLITAEEFNTRVQGWTMATRGRMRVNAPVGTKDRANRKEPKLGASVGSSIRKDFGEISRVRFQFARHGIYVHYGVGRGYIRNGGAVVRGFVTHKSVGVKASRNESSRNGINRSPDDWFDVEIKQNFDQLAGVTQEYYGDWAMNDVLDKMSKFLIQKKK